MKQYRWVPATLYGAYPDGTRWEFQSLSDSPGYWKYEARVCKAIYVDNKVYCEEGQFDSMKEAAKAVYAAALLAK